MSTHCDNHQRACVLVVDDDITARLLARRSLEKAGYIVAEAEDGLEALGIFEETRPDLVLLDVEMPNLDGYQTCIRLRALPNGKTVPVLMVTGLEDVASIERAYEAGATDFAHKPINWTILGHRVRYMLRTSELVDELANSRASLANAQHLARLGNWEWHLEINKVRWSDEIYRIIGVEPGTIPNTLAAFMELIHKDDRNSVKAAFVKTLKTGQEVAVCFRMAGDTHSADRVVSAHTQVVCDDQGRVVRLLGTLQDVTERKQAEEQIRYLAYFDSLTGLANRQLFRERVTQAFTLAKRHRRQLAVLFLDLDDFKRINDTLGHNVGDLLLKAIANQLRGILRGADGVTQPTSQVSNGNNEVARLGGDEFMILLSEIRQAEDAAVVARRILEKLSEPLHLAGHNVFVTPSIGIAVFPHDGEEVDTLFKNADTAMYYAKRAGKNAYQFYDDSMNKAALERLTLENALRSALRNNEFSLHYQPQLDLMSGSIVGVEALLRWHNPVLGHVSPGDFIPLAEETGLIIPIGTWVLKTACAQAKAWHTQGLKPLRVAVNLSVRQFMQTDLPEQIAAILNETGLAAPYLELELTESLLMQDVEQAIVTMDALKTMGVRLAIDDFGTGYSSLSYLKRFPIDRLKIDQSFVRDITSDPNNAAIALAVVSMAHSLKLGVVAEGVETHSQEAFLRSKLCDEIQGFHISHPLPPKKLAKLIQWYRLGILDGDDVAAEKNCAVLLVDAESVATEALGDRLRSEGYHVLTAATACQALELLASSNVGVVVSDHAMPDMMGTELLHRVSKLYPKTVRILLSHCRDVDTLINAINEAQVYRFLDKSVSEEKLLNTLREAFLSYYANRLPVQPLLTAPAA